jgi:hypothetical protein
MDFSDFFFQWKIWLTGSTARGLGGAAQVHRGPRQRGQKGTTVVEEDEPDKAVPEGFSPEHERRWRGSATEAKNGSGLSSA